MLSSMVPDADSFKSKRKFRVRVSSLQRWSKETVRTSLVFEGGSGEVGRARSRCPRRTLPPPPSLAYLGVKLSRSPLRARGPLR